MKLPKLGELNLEKLKKMGNDLVAQVKSGEALEKIKAGVTSAKDEITKKIDEFKGHQEEGKHPTPPEQAHKDAPPPPEAPNAEHPPKAPKPTPPPPPKAPEAPKPPKDKGE